MTASFSRSCLTPISGSAGPGLQVKTASVSTFPRIKPQGAQRTNIIVWSSENSRADLFELTLSRFLDDSLFHDHRTTATIHLRNGFPCRQRIERLAVLERFD